jgi:hypothetical protein
MGVNWDNEKTIEIKWKKCDLTEKLYICRENSLLLIHRVLCPG